jgi:hypothetical protein
MLELGMATLQEVAPEIEIHQLVLFAARGSLPALGRSLQQAYGRSAYRGTSACDSQYSTWMPYI